MRLCGSMLPHNRIINNDVGVDQRNFNLDTSSKWSASSPDRCTSKKCLRHKLDRLLGVSGHSRVRHFLLFIELFAFCIIYIFFFYFYNTSSLSSSSLSSSAAAFSGFCCEWVWEKEESWNTFLLIKISAVNIYVRHSVKSMCTNGSWLYVIRLHFSHRSVQLIFSGLIHHHISELFRYFCSTLRRVQVSAHFKAVFPNVAFR